jgi:hypothetical protein
MDSESPSSPFAGFSRSFLLTDPCADRAFRADLDLTDEFALLRGESNRDAPIRGTWAMGSTKPDDVVWTTLAVPLLLSDRVIGLLRESRFTGWDTVPVELVDKNGHTLPTYHFLRVLGRCGPILNERSVKFDRIMPGGVFPSWRGLYFDPVTWKGTDVYMSTSDVAWIFVTDGVKRVFESARVRNVKFTPLNEVERTSGVDSESE